MSPPIGGSNMKYDVTQSATLKVSDKPITVTDEVTPITQQPVEQIMSHMWHSDDVSLEFLNNQMSILIKRLNFANQMHQQQMVVHLQQAIQELDVAITNHLNKQD